MERCLWCCKAASVPSKSRGRILGELSSILFSRDRPFHGDTPLVLQTLMQGIFSLMFTLSCAGDAHQEIDSLTSYASAIRSGKCGSLSISAVEKEYGVRFAKEENEDAVREVIVAESAINCLEMGSEQSRRWCLHNILMVNLP